MSTDRALSPAEGLLHRWLYRQGFCGIRHSQFLRAIYFLLAKGRVSTIRVADEFS